VQKRRREVPPDLLRDASRRLGMATIATGLVAIAVAAASNFLHNINLIEYHPVERVAYAFMLALSIGLFILSRGNRFAPETLLNMGLVYEVLICLAISIADAFPPITTIPQIYGESWACVMIVLYPVLIPATPARTFMTALAAACMGPLAYSLSILYGAVALPPSYIFMLYLGEFLAALLAVTPALVITHLVEDVTQAREMGSYILEKKLGEGGMGEVWLARHRMLRRPAAVKLIRAEVLGEDRAGQLQRFEREAQATANLRSPNTVTLYDFGVADDGSFYYVMELLDGLDLDSLVRRFGALPPERVARLLLQACRSLDEAHAIGFVHRDIKPANVYVCRLGSQVDFVKLLDFGLVKSTQPTDVALTAADVVYGTPAFMAPEQARGETLSGATDLYALGCVGYWLLTGLYVFPAPTPMQMAIEHAYTVPTPPSKRNNQDIPAALEAIIMQCLEKDPAARPKSAHLMARLLIESGLVQQWTEDRAMAWWKENMGGAASSVARARLETGGGVGRKEGDAALA